MLELGLIYLGVTPQNGVRFMAPGAIHQARWMIKIIYTMKIWLFRSQFKLTSKEETGLSDICVFVVRLWLHHNIAKAKVKGAVDNVGMSMKIGRCNC